MSRSPRLPLRCRSSSVRSASPPASSKLVWNKKQLRRQPQRANWTPGRRRVSTAMTPRSDRSPVADGRVLTSPLGPDILDEQLHVPFADVSEESPLIGFLVQGHRAHNSPSAARGHELDDGDVLRAVHHEPLDRPCSLLELIHRLPVMSHVADRMGEFRQRGRDGN